MGVFNACRQGVNLGYLYKVLIGSGFGSAPKILHDPRVR
jgi:hypothetical protein